jgi:predicted  nucleic acid-binding Zn-ribbon protein
MNTDTLTKGGLTEAGTAINKMEAAMEGFARTTITDLLTEQENLVQQQREAQKLEDTVQRSARLEIINSNMADLEAKINEYREDTAELIAGLEAHFAKLGIELSELEKPAPEDMEVVRRAEAHLKSLDLNDPESTSSKEKNELDVALAEAEGAWIGKLGKVANAQVALARFSALHEQDLAEAQTAFEEAKAEVERRRRARIRNAEFDRKFERFIEIASEIQAKLLENVKASEARMGETRKALTDALTQREKLAGDLQETEEKIREAEDNVLTLEQELASAVDQTQRTQIDSRLGNARTQLADLNGARQEMQVVFNSLEAATVKHDTMLQSLQIQRDNQRAHALKLQADSKARFTQAQNLVSIIKNTAQEEAAGRLHSVGSSLDRMGIEVAARALIASERQRLQMLEGHKGDMEQFAETTSALAEGRAKVALEDAEIATRMRDHFGINPLDSSWLHLAQRVTEPKTDEAA